MSELKDILRRAEEQSTLLKSAYLLTAEPAAQAWRWAAALVGGLISLLLPIGSAALCIA